MEGYGGGGDGEFDGGFSAGEEGVRGVGVVDGEVAGDWLVRFEN